MGCLVDERHDWPVAEFAVRVQDQRAIVGEPEAAQVESTRHCPELLAHLPELVGRAGATGSRSEAILDTYRPYLGSMQQVLQFAPSSCSRAPIMGCEHGARPGRSGSRGHRGEGLDVEAGRVRGGKPVRGHVGKQCAEPGSRRRTAGGRRSGPASPGRQGGRALRGRGVSAVRLLRVAADPPAPHAS